MGHPPTIQIPGPQGPPPQEPDTDDSGDPFQKIIDAARAAASSDGTVSKAEMLIVEQITTLVAKLQAGREKEQQAALGGGPATQFLRRASGG
jgi:uncharacterized membrane protein YebE (DUF533 family)